MDNEGDNNITNDLLYKNNIPIGKKKILIAAIDLFYEQGFDKTSTVQIAESAGISEGAIYKHFRSKRGLLDAIIDPMISNLLSNCNNSLTIDINGNGKEAILILVKDKMSYIYNNRKILKILMIELLTSDTIYSEIKSICTDNYPLISNGIYKFLEKNNVSDKKIIQILISDLLYEFFKIILLNNYDEDQLEHKVEGIVEDILNYVS